MNTPLFFLSIAGAIQKTCPRCIAPSSMSANSCPTCGGPLALKVNMKDFETALRVIIQPILSGHLCAIRQELEAIFAPCPVWVPWVEHHALIYLLLRLLSSDLPRLEYEANEFILLYPDAAASVTPFIKKIKDYMSQVSKSLKSLQSIECPNPLADLLAKDGNLWVEYETQSQIAGNAGDAGASNKTDALTTAAGELDANRQAINDTYGTLEGLNTLVTNYNVYTTGTVEELPEGTFAPEILRKKFEYGAAIRALRGATDFTKQKQTKKKARRKISGGRR